METRANFVAVGLFTLLVIFASFAFIYWVANLEDSVNQVPLNVEIRGAVTGLATGSEVHFNGIRVGKVRRVVFDADDPEVVYALTDVNADTPIRTDTTATLGVQGLTGIAYISLKGGSRNAESLFEANESGIPTIEARPSAVSDILETVRDVATKANSTLVTIEAFIDENRAPISRTVGNIETFSQALERNSDGVDKFLASASGLGDSITSLSDKLDGTIRGVESLVEAVDPEKVKSTVDNVEAFSGNLRKGGERIDGMVDSVEQVAKNLEQFSGKLDATLAKLDGVIGAVEPETVRAAIADIRETASGAKAVVADARSVSQTVAGRKEDIDQIIANTRQMSDRLNRSSERVDQVLVKLDGFLGSDETGSVMTDVRDTLAEFRKVATNLQSSINGVSSGLTRFSNTGLSDVRALVGDMRRSVSRIDRVVGEIERNPQRFLFGNDEVKTYNGRPRR